MYDYLVKVLVSDFTRRPNGVGTHLSVLTVRCCLDRRQVLLFRPSERYQLCYSLCYWPSNEMPC
ncbi:hypothetical protein JI435_413370 [Parastagonospora nodorum SN15]|uniref:Uncharacterized protein n=1 Tax=Phaeosphaeria nodorum (strain SN15 / ATCC MYA-4574 / FGSC 10173) TaxID=321614 RepID=A0A7U2FAD6_PHANO|nr:hypothetical protein JI435_413370 [Parastagonospora nodorum SN15]